MSYFVYPSFLGQQKFHGILSVQTTQTRLTHTLGSVLLERRAGLIIDRKGIMDKYAHKRRLYE